MIISNKILNLLLLVAAAPIAPRSPCTPSRRTTIEAGLSGSQALHVGIGVAALRLRQGLAAHPAAHAPCIVRIQVVQCFEPLRNFLFYKE